MYYSWLILCLALVTVTDQKRARVKHEVFAFVLPTHSDTWMRFDWTKLTTIALVGFLDKDLIRFAHGHHVRVVRLANLPKAELSNERSRHRWVKREVRLAQKHRLDGVNLDFEEDLAAKSPEAEAYTALVRELVETFHEALPGSQVSVDVAWSPKCVDGRCYDYATVADLADLIFVMSYDEQSQMWDETTCEARANSPLKQTFDGIREYLRLGVDPRKMILGVPWYGYVYPCLSLQHDLCQIRAVPFRGCKCSDAAGTELEFNLVMKLLEKSTGGLKWDKESSTPYFNFRGNDTRWHQVWFDNPQSLKIKYDMAGQALGLGGFGMWTANHLDYDNATQVRQMWDAIPD